MSEPSETQEASPSQAFSRLDIGVLITLTSLAIAGVGGLIAVFDASNRYSAIAIGLGVAVLIFQGGATIACALACLVRGRLEAFALGSLVAVGLSLDLFVLAIWLEIDNESYAKVTGIASIWSFFALLVLGLSLAAQPRDSLARGLHLGAVGASLLGGVLATVFILSAGDTDVAVSESPLPYPSFGNDDLLRPLGAVLIVVAALWFAALATTRVARTLDS